MRTVAFFLFASLAVAQNRVVIEAGTILDGRGGALHNRQIVIENGRIVSIAAGRSSRITTCAT
jgi:N-acyl-D-aspartate/D-glutamate deacylase